MYKVKSSGNTGHVSKEKSKLDKDIWDMSTSYECTNWKNGP